MYSAIQLHSCKSVNKLTYLLTCYALAHLTWWCCAVGRNTFTVVAWLTQSSLDAKVDSPTLVTVVL